MLIEEKIKSIRELKNYTQGYMAEELGITQAAYSKIESGQTKLTMNKINDIAQIFEIPVEDLVAYDSQRYFNSFNNVKGSNNGSVIGNGDTELITKLYEDKINLLERLLHATENELLRYKEKYGEL